MPEALARQDPNANQDWAWQWVVHGQNRWRGAEGEEARRDRSRCNSSDPLGHLEPFFRHPPFGAGQAIHPSQVLPSHKDVSTTRIDIHGLNRSSRGYTAQQALCGKLNRWFSAP